MRAYYSGIFKEFFCLHLMRTRYSLVLTQTSTAQLLQMGFRSYTDIEHGHNGASGLTLALYLIYLCDNPLAFLSDLCSAMNIPVPDHISNTISDTNGAVSYRLPCSVKDIKRDANGHRHAVCPRCGKLLQHTDMLYCEHCGQKLNWNSFPAAIVN